MPTRRDSSHPSENQIIAYLDARKPNARTRRHIRTCRQCLRLLGVIGADTRMGGELAGWKRLKPWLATFFPGQLALFDLPAAAEAIAAVETTLQTELPIDYKEFLACHNGQRSEATFVEHCTLLQIEQAPDCRAVLHRLLRHQEREVTLAFSAQPTAESTAWLPIGCNRQADTLLCIATSPTHHLQRGQIFLVKEQANRYSRLADSFNELLMIYQEQLETGTIVG